MQRERREEDLFQHTGANKTEAADPGPTETQRGMHTVIIRQNDVTHRPPGRGVTCTHRCSG